MPLVNAWVLVVLRIVLNTVRLDQPGGAGLGGGNNQNAFPSAVTGRSSQITTTPFLTMTLQTRPNLLQPLMRLTENDTGKSVSKESPV